MLFLMLLAFIASSYLISDIAATGTSNRIRSPDKDIDKQSGGLMHQLVNLLANEKFHRKTNEMVDRMVKQNGQILKQFAGFSNKLEKFERNFLKEKGKVTSKMKALKKEVDIEKMNQEKIIKKIWKDIEDIRSTRDIQQIKKTVTMLSKQLESHINTINYRITNLKTSVENGAVYIRWGRTKCPSSDTRLVYSGYAAGAKYTDNNGADTQCLPKNPTWRKYHDARNDAGYIYGAEFEINHSVGEALDNSYYNYDVQCVVCQSTKRLNVHMIPATDKCNRYGWHREYRGYLMIQGNGHGASNYICVDARPEKIGTNTNHNGRVFYPVESICGSLPCPPYVNNRELTCAVCTF